MSGDHDNISRLKAAGECSTTEAKQNSQQSRFGLAHKVKLWWAWALGGAWLVFKCVSISSGVSGLPHGSV